MRKKKKEKNHFLYVNIEERMNVGFLLKKYLQNLDTDFRYCNGHNWVCGVVVIGSWNGVFLYWLVKVSWSWQIFDCGFFGHCCHFFL